MKKSTIIQITVSLLAIAVVLYLSDFEKVIQIITHVNFFYLLISIAFYIVVNLLMGFRIKMLLNEMKEKISFWEATEDSFSGMLASDFTPGRTGYFATAFLITANTKIKIHQTMLSIFGPQIFDFALKLIGGGIALWYLLGVVLPLSEGGSGAKFAGMLLGAGIFLAIIVFMILLLFSERFVRYISFMRMLPYGAYFHSLLSDMQKNSKTLMNMFVPILLLSLLGWGAKSAEWLFMAKSVGMQISNFPYPEIVFFAFLQPIVTILQFIPAPTLAGMGLSEGGTAAVLLLFGIPPYQSVAFALMSRFMNVFVDLIGIKGAVKLIDRIG